VNIALDWDGTYTADQWLWDTFIASAKSRGHTVYCVTARIANPQNIAEVRIEGVETIFCGLASKPVVTEARGIKIDVWIDDDVAMCLLGKDGAENIRYRRTVPVRYKPPRGRR
jgi:hypothetical protein